MAVNIDVMMPSDNVTAKPRIGPVPNVNSTMATISVVVLGIFPEGGITGDGNIQRFKPGIDKIISEKPVEVVPVALCCLWGSLFSRRDPLLKRRPYKLWAKIELRIGAPIPPHEVTAARLQEEVQRLRGDDR